jgi:serine/threonine-protein kinase
VADPESSLAAALGDRYRLDRVLGEGGMATVYLAHDLKHDRPVALKVLKPELAHALGPERFEREIKLAARLQHPHILTVLDSGEAAVERSALSAQRSALLYFTMPYVEGESLRDRLNREKQLSLDDALRIAREAAQALQYAHEHGVIHRDIKPENLLLTKDGSTLVADFGIARALGASESGTLTQTGMALGTPAYMSPEQASAEADLSPRTDIYSLGAVLFEMLAGEPPFTGPSVQAVIAKRFSGAVPSIRGTRANVPAMVDQAVTRALAVVPADRWASAAEFGRALTPAATTAFVASPAGGATRRVSPALITLILGLLIGGGALFAWRGSAGNESRVPAGAARDAATASAPVRIAVLPFDNVGDSSDAYFADGVTDAVRGKLTALHGIEVIARQSSEEYRGSTKPLRQIADELGVDYLLTGTVRWAKAADGTSRVQVSPELVEIGDGTARSRWQQPFDAPLTDVFQVQGTIAGQVASALNVALGASDQQELAERPTQNLAAYDSYLRGSAIQGIDGASVRRKIAFLKDAVARDSSFGAAWARLVQAQVQLTSGAEPRSVIAAALRRAEALAPEAPETYRARYSLLTLPPGNSDSALAVAEAGLLRYPGNPELLRAKGVSELLLGRNESALATLRRTRALDPRSLPAARAFASALLSLRRFPEARAAYEAGLALDPTDQQSLQNIVGTYLFEGDLAGAQRFVAQVSPDADRRQFYAYLAMYNDLYWVLTPGQQDTVLTLPVSYFDGDAPSRAFAHAEIYRLRGDSAGMRAWADSASRLLLPLSRDAAGDPQYEAILGMVEAYQGKASAGLRSIRQALNRTMQVDSSLVPYVMLLEARARAVTGDLDGALARLETIPPTWVVTITPELLPLLPDLRPLHGQPRFEALARHH